MALFNWDASLSVKVKDMDDQHMRILEMINEVHEAMRAGKGNDAVSGILFRLKAYSQQHFAIEERLMEQKRYPGLPQQKMEHAKFIAQVNEFEKAMHSKGVVSGVSIYAFLKDWLVKHIKEIDQRYTPYMADAMAR